MPHINRIRVNNVKYNFGTQFYDDFIMRFSGKNTIYDLANGGGKSVLMLLLLQNLIPNCTLDEKQPVEKLFRSGNGSNTIHSMVEWKLDKENIKDNFKYMMTGFCARKSREEESDGDNASIDYFNYVVFYREFNDNDIKNFPLSDGKERITYNGLKSYLRDIEKKDFGLKIKIFEKKGDYQRFINDYGLYESQWEIIRGINKTEGHVRTYFENNYKTTRKVVEDLLIEEIIEKSFKTRVETEGGEDLMAVTLMEIKDKLLELSKKKEDIHSYDLEIEAINNFNSRILNIKQLYFGKEDLEEQIIKGINTIDHLVEKRDEDLEYLNLDYINGQKQLREIEKHIEIAKVQKNTDILQLTEKDIENLDGEVKVLKTEYENIKNKLIIMESENDYLDHIYYKKEHDEIKEIIDNAKKDKSHLIEELSYLAGIKAYKNRKKSEELESFMEKEEKNSFEEESLIKELEIKEKNTIKNSSVKEYLYEEYRKKLEDLNEKIFNLKSDLNIILSTDIQKEKNESSRKILKSCQRLQELEGEKTFIIDEKNRIELTVHDNNVRLMSLDSFREEMGETRQKNDIIRDRIEKICEIYSEYNEERLTEVISEKYRELIEELKKIKDEIKELKKYSSDLQNGCPVGKTEEMETVLSYIEKYHGDVALRGSEFILSLENDKKAQILERIPFLPYSLVIKSNFHNISGDEKLMDIIKTDHAVPMLRVESVYSNDYLIDSGNVSFVMKDTILFTDEKELLNELYRTNEKLKDMGLKYTRIMDGEKSVKEDYDFVKEYLDVFRDEMIKSEKEYEAKKVEQKQLEAENSILKEKMNSLLEDLLKLESEEKENKIISQKLNQEAQKFENLVILMEEADAYELKVNEIKDEYRGGDKEILNVREKIISHKNRLSLRKEEINRCREKLKDIQKEWNREYIHYFNGTEIENDDILEDEIQSKFSAMRKIIENEITELKDKQKMMDNYHMAMEKSLQAIDYKGIDIKIIIDRYNKGLVRENDKETLVKNKKEIDLIQSSLKEKEESLGRKISEKYKIEGGMNHGKIMIQEKYGEFSHIEIGSRTYDQFIEQKHMEKDILEEKLDEISKQLKISEEKGSLYFVLKRDMDRIKNISEFKFHNSKERFPEGTDLEQTIQGISDRFEKYKKEVAKRKEEFENDKNMLIDIIKSLSSFELANEMTKNVMMPESISETDELIESMEDIIKCIHLEKERIEKNIIHMEKIRESFENQCIQSCINIKTELEKLTRLSRIYLDDESISIIGLTVPYVKEEFYKGRMSEYIKDIVETADNIKDVQDKMKHIKGQLSWKKLFSVIVTDMNSIKLTLYKRERIKEQSRYLRYEEAVGSTGQSQGIYIQFLIGIINYITSINSGNSESNKLGKVLFIDNPFGAAKDIYIWEPIFKMLKTNNVQLVVPCRGATPAITGRFDVNYVLGQKLIDGKQNTVVVNYYSNVERDNLEYEKLSFDQEKMTFE